jgi:hypothetical protein
MNTIDKICLLATEVRFAKSDEEAQVVIDKIRAAIEQALNAQVSDGYVLVKSGALQMVVNALRRDAADGKTVRGEMADELIAVNHSHNDKQALGQGEPVMLVPQQELDELRRCNGMAVWAENPQLYPPYCEGEIPAGYVPLFTAPQPQPQPKPKQEALAKAWDEGYRAGINDERMSEANIGIAGFDAKVEPARNNPYSTAPQPHPKQEAVATAEFNRVINHAIEQGSDAAEFLRYWREGHWDGCREFGFEPDTAPQPQPQPKQGAVALEISSEHLDAVLDTGLIDTCGMTAYEAARKVIEAFHTTPQPQPKQEPLSKKWRWGLHESFFDVADFDDAGIPWFYSKESSDRFQRGKLSAPCKGKNCGSLNGWLHSDECRTEHEAQYTTRPAAPDMSQPQSEWVGLDEADLANCDTEEYKVARCWEAKLREKNGGGV